MKKIICILLILTTMLCGCNGGPTTNYKYDYAYISMPDGSTILCEIDSWTIMEDCYAITTMDGTRYLVNSINCVMVENNS